MSRFAEKVWEMYQKSWRTCRAIVFANEPFCFWTCFGSVMAEESFNIILCVLPYPKNSFIQISRHHRSSLYGRGIFDSGRSLHLEYHLSALLRKLLRFFWTTCLETAIYYRRYHLQCHHGLHFFSLGWDRTSGCKGASCSRYQSIFDLTHPPTHPTLWMWKENRPQHWSRGIPPTHHERCVGA